MNKNTCKSCGRWNSDRAGGVDEFGECPACAKKSAKVTAQKAVDDIYCSIDESKISTRDCCHLVCSRRKTCTPFLSLKFADITKAMTIK